MFSGCFSVFVFVPIELDISSSVEIKVHGGDFGELR